MGSASTEVAFDDYFHGGWFCIEAAFSPTYHNYLNTLVAAANIVAISVDYRRAPEHAVPIAYDDSWTALKCVASHSNGSGNEDCFQVLHRWLDALGSIASGLLYVYHTPFVP
ncbi:Abhydrolase_3 domain-containing protein [Cephalotus follicularis]|uniref:Abhydrolase_3 domain-containing protein n=1 Tax=Cephalotus follicularis TaxID=3775 RepID=A0A1Q3APW8_CEPFO|nr:Abhydrolase_3 domain-containing protein [Cephalotus follicularis]